MPKDKTPLSVLLKNWMNADPHLSTDGKIVFCQACNKQVSVELDYY